MTQILIIDDDPIIQLVLRKTLEEQDYDVSIAQSGEEGILQIQKNHPTLIICDWLMPGIDGLEVCRQVKSDPSLANIFFILLTSRSSVEDKVKGLDMGADDFLSKPIDVNELRARVRAGLRLCKVTQELQKLSQDLKEQAQILEAELAEAADYVKSILPVPIQGELSIDSRFLPSRQLGGDCFDYYWLDADHLVIYLLDMSGHGLGAALPSISIQTLLRSQSLPDISFYQPDAVLRALNEAFQMNQQSDRYFTIWYGIYNHSTRQLTYASAGHPPAILISQGGIQKLKTQGLPIGMFPQAKYVNGSCQISAFSTLYIFSDGLYEIEQADGKLWAIDGFIQLLAEKNSPDTNNLDQILHTVRTIQGSDFFVDDCSLLKVRFN
jgi:sigma-B regulation protein RsbU (phosphoserine phosphatase)